MSRVFSFWIISFILFFVFPLVNNNIYCCILTHTHRNRAGIYIEERACVCARALWPEVKIIMIYLRQCICARALSLSLSVLHTSSCLHKTTTTLLRRRLFFFKLFSSFFFFFVLLFFRVATIYLYTLVCVCARARSKIIIHSACVLLMYVHKLRVCTSYMKQKKKIKKKERNVVFRFRKKKKN